MAEIAYHVPTDVSYVEGSDIGEHRPGLQVVRFPSGRVVTRDWYGYNVRQYDLRPALFQSSSNTLRDWQIFLKQIRNGGDFAWILETTSDTHAEMLCGPITDGTKTTFAVPCLSPSSEVVFVDGVLQSSGYTLRSAANLLDDDHAKCDDITYTSVANATEANAPGIAVKGSGSIKVTPDEVGQPRLTSKDKTTGVTAGDSYTAISAVLNTKTTDNGFRTVAYWYQSDDTYIGLTNGSYSQVKDTDGWQVISGAHTAPALSSKFIVAIEREQTAGTEPFYAGCFSLACGDYDRWHLPSVAPGLIEFDSAPATDRRVTATVTGRRIARCFLEAPFSWSLRSPGHAYPTVIKAVEVPEF